MADAGPRHASGGGMELRQVRQMTLEAPRSEFASEERSCLYLAFRPDDRKGDLRSDALWAVALQADADATPSIDLSAVWQDVLVGRLTVCGEGSNSSRRYLLARVRPRSGAG